MMENFEVIEKSECVVLSCFCKYEPGNKNTGSFAMFSYRDSCGVVFETNNQDYLLPLLTSFAKNKSVWIDGVFCQRSGGCGEKKLLAIRRIGLCESDLDK